MPVVGQRRHGDVGDVVGIDERLELVAGRQNDLAAGAPSLPKNNGEVARRLDPLDQLKPQVGKSAR